MAVLRLFISAMVALKRLRSKDISIMVKTVVATKAIKTMAKITKIKAYPWDCFLFLIIFKVRQKKLSGLGRCLIQKQSQNLCAAY